MISINQDIPYKELGNGVQRKVLAAEGQLMTAQFHFPKGAVGAPHSHPHEQVGYVVSGGFEFTLEGTTRVVALEDSVLVDVFTPQRQDFL